MFFDPTMLLLIPAFLFAMYAQNKIRRTYDKYQQVRSSRGMTGYETAMEILRLNNIYDVKVEEVQGTLTDHYDPRDRTVRLSSANYHGRSLAAASVAAHEIGHVIQHVSGYSPLQLRHSILPVTNIGSTLAWPLAIAGLLFSYPPLITLGIIAFTGVVVFHVVTLPVEFNASSRAMVQLTEHGMLHRDEAREAKKVLDAAALTYVAAAAMAVTNLIRLLILRNMASD